jgi:hypothetical protein
MIEDGVLRFILYVIGFEIVAILFILMFVTFDLWRSVARVKTIISTAEDAVDNVHTQVKRFSSLTAAVPAVIALVRQFTSSDSSDEESPEVPKKRRKKVI